MTRRTTAGIGATLGFALCLLTVAAAGLIWQPGAALAIAVSGLAFLPDFASAAATAAASVAALRFAASAFFCSSAAPRRMPSTMPIMR